MDPLKIVVLDGYGVTQQDADWESFNEIGEIQVFPRTEPDLIAARIGNADAAITSKCRIDAAAMDACPNLRYIGESATGYNNIDVEAAKARGIAVTNVPDYSTDSVVQGAMALLFELACRTGLHDAAVRAGEWQRSKDFCLTVAPLTELSGKTIGIIGYGHIGKKVARVCAALGMRVLVFTPHPPAALPAGGDASSSLFTGGDALLPPPEFLPFDELLAASDVISLHCPLTPENGGMIGAETIAKMKDGVWLINTARGGLVREDDLAAALKSGKVGAAGLDVLTKEPPDLDNPLIGLPNAVITPHVAWLTTEARRRLIGIMIDNLRVWASGGIQNRIV